MQFHRFGAPRPLFVIAACATFMPAAGPLASAAGAQAGPPSGGPGSYASVITAAAKTERGVFTVHHVGDKWYYEIPAGMLGREFLIASRIARTANGVDNYGEENGENVVRFVREGARVLVRQVSYGTIADTAHPLGMAVRNSILEPVIVILPIAAHGRDSSVVIDVGPLYTGDVPMLGLDSEVRSLHKVGRLDTDRTLVNGIGAYHGNIETRVTQTYEAEKPTSGRNAGAISLEMNHSMFLLPAIPMMPRLFDQRVGYFGLSQTDYSRDEPRAVTRRYIKRWRLEPRDTAAFRRGELVEPVKPIVFYLDPATPLKWRRYLIAGVNDWQAAFEGAGFKNAISAREAPTPEEDPEFSTEDSRYSMIRYFATKVDQATGPTVADPRTGEILESHISWHHNVMNGHRNWYLAQTAAVDPGARSVAFTEELTGALLRATISHEVGHALGLPHNFKASSAYPVDSLRSPTFTREFHVTPTIMESYPYNYVAQPGDGDVALRHAIGPYDRYSLSWGYRPILDAKTPDAEKPVLDGWIRAHAGDPIYRFGEWSRTDPGSQWGDLGDDGVKASGYGVANLKRIVPRLREYAYEPRADHSQLRELYGMVGEQWATLMRNTVTIIGGIEQTRKDSDQPGPIYTAVPRDRQFAAMGFLADEALRTPTWLFDSTIVQLIGVQGSTDRIKGYMSGVLDALLDPERIARLAELEVVADGGYPLPEFLGDVRAAVWTELASGAAPDFYRRALQRAWVERLGYLIAYEPPPPEAEDVTVAPPIPVSRSDLRPLVRFELVAMHRRLVAAANRGDTVSQAHYADAAARIQRILDPP